MASEEPHAANGLVEMTVESVRVHMLSSRHVVILKEREHDRYLPIWIGPWEASAIAMKLQGLTADRPHFRGIDGPPVRSIHPVDRTFFFGVGGVILINADQPEGVYTADYTVTADYL